MSISIKLKTFVKKVELDLEKLPADLTNAIVVANSILQPAISGIQAALNSNAGVSIEAAIPNGAAYAGAVEGILTTLSASLTALTQLKDTSGVAGVLAQAKTDIVNAIAGASHDLPTILRAWDHVLS